MNKIHKEEMDIYGFTNLGNLLTKDQVDFFRTDLPKRKEEHIKKNGRELLDKYNELEFLRNCGSFHENYISIIESDWFNETINVLLNEKAILHGYHAILTNSESKDKANSDRFSPMRFHRDAPWFKDMRTCVLILMPLVDFSEDNGPTEYVPSTHLFKEMPSQEFLEKNAKQMIAPAGTVFAMDGATYHRAGINRSGSLRPMLQMNVTLAFMKQQIDVWSNDAFSKCSDLAKARLGFNVRTYTHPDEMFQDDRKWKSGNYDMNNTSIR
jgi:ectoine hydroxylase-related dioxygenase (phytanoyl-CoA dioxygenase family)